jgi:hypothetical protein
MDQPEHKASSQNRLLVLALALTFYYYAEAKAEGLSLLGSTIRFGNTDALVEFGWAVWAYYYLRTYQYYKDVGHSSYAVAFRSLLIKSFEPHLPLHKRNELSVYERREAPEPLEAGVALHYSGRIFSRIPESPSLFARPLHAMISAVLAILRGRLQRSRGGPLQINFIRTYRLKRLRRWFIAPVLPLHLRLLIYPKSNFDYLQGGERIELPIPWARTYRIALVYVKSIFLRPAFWENYGPLVLGLLPVWYVIFMYRQNLELAFH